MPIKVTMPDGEIAQLARQLATRLGVTEIEAVRFALRDSLESHHESEKLLTKIEKLEAERNELLNRVEQLQLERKRYTRTAEPRQGLAYPAESADEAARRRERAIDRITALTSVLPVLDRRSDAEILGYDEMTR